MNFSIHQASHIGNRKFNQDRVAYAYNDAALLLLLADGMGGHLHGERAATTAIETFMTAFEAQGPSALDDPAGFLADTMRTAHARIMDFDCERNQTFPGTTCVAALVQDGSVHIGHAGDSRCYLMRDGRVLLRTLDHSMVQQWLDLELISEEEARIHPQRNHITNCLGGLDDQFYFEPTPPVALRDGDLLLLCSDGLWSPFSDRELVDAFRGQSVSDALDGLLGGALKREPKRSDNVTGLALRWGGEDVPQTGTPVSCVLDIH